MRFASLSFFFPVDASLIVTNDGPTTAGAILFFFTFFDGDNGGDLIVRFFGNTCFGDDIDGDNGDDRRFDFFSRVGGSGGDFNVYVNTVDGLFVGL